MSKLRCISSVEARRLLTFSDDESMSSSSEDSTDEDFLDYNNDPGFEDAQQEIDRSRSSPRESNNSNDHDDEIGIDQPSTSTAPPRSRGRPRSNGSRTNGRAAQPIIDPRWREVREGGTNNNFRFAPPVQPGVNAPLTPTSSALDCLFVLLNMEIITQLILDINSYAEKRIGMNRPARKHSLYNNWTPVTLADLFRYLTVLIAMRLNKRPKFRDFWSTKKHQYNRWYRDTLVRERFEAIHHTMLHCADSEAESKEKVEPFINRLLKQFQQAFYPYQELSLDEMVIGWKGRFKYKSYNPNKPSKYNVKTFGLCDSATGYVVNLLTYFGKETSYDPNLDDNAESAIKVFQTLLRPLAKGHHIFADRYYTTYNLVRYLASQHFYYTGTVQANRRNFPPEFRQLKLEKQESRFFTTEDDTLLAVAWRDKKAKKHCMAVTAKGDTAIVEARNRRGQAMHKPIIIDEYNKSMNGCDKMDQNLTYYGVFTRKTKKWWKKIFHWILEVTQMNAFILYRLSRADNTRHVSLQDFKVMLIEELTIRAEAEIGPEGDAPPKKKGRPSDGSLARFQGNTHLVKYVKKDSRCVVCSTPADRKRTNFVCVGCPEQPHMHAKECFLKYHTPGAMPDE